MYLGCGRMRSLVRGALRVFQSVTGRMLGGHGRSELGSRKAARTHATTTERSAEPSRGGALGTMEGSEGSHGEGTVGVGLLDLPPECVFHICNKVGSPSDSAALTMVCKALHGILCSEAGWRQRLLQDFDVALEPAEHGPEPVDGAAKLRAVHQQLLSVENMKPIRFRGCFTDGGCDEGQMRYWVDNMFVPNHWESYCSDIGANVNCIGVLLDDFDVDERATEHRQFLVERCQYAVNRLFQRPVDLNTWTTAELEHFFQELFTELQNRSPIGQLLVHGYTTPDKFPQELQRLRSAMLHIQIRQEAYQLIAPVLDFNDEAANTGAASTSKQRSLKLIDKRILRRAPWQYSSAYVASLDYCSISRAGNFSCPVACGAIFLGNLDFSGWKDEETLQQSMQDVVALKYCLALNSATSREAIDDAVKRGDLPRILAYGETSCAEWIEFAPHSEDRRPHQTLKPVVWFRFFTASEMLDRKVRKMEVAFSGANQESATGDDGSVEAEDVTPVSDGLTLDSDDDSTERSNARKSTKGRNFLKVPLTSRHGGNMALVKLISNEDLRAEWDDDHEQPNVDINFVELHGSLASIDGLRLCSLSRKT